MDQELRDFLLALESRLDSKFDSKLNSRLGELESRLMAHTEAVETRLLSEFWKWARTSEIKTRQNTTGISAIEERLTAVEDRVRDLERRRPS